jgi:hypothetical protein
MPIRNGIRAMLAKKKILLGGCVIETDVRSSARGARGRTFSHSEECVQAATLAARC